MSTGIVVAFGIDRLRSTEVQLTTLERRRAPRLGLAETLLECHRRRGDPEALAEARDICTELGATAWLAQLENRRSAAPA